MDARIEETLAHFKQDHLEAGPHLFKGSTTFLSFLSTLSALEALAGYRYPQIGSPGLRFRTFLTSYLPAPYHPHAQRLWDFRNGMVHAFSPRGAAIAVNASEVHLTVNPETGTLALNAQDFYGGMVEAFKAYHAALQELEELQQAFLIRLDSPDGGEIHTEILGFGEVH